MIRHCNVAFRRHRALALLVGSIVVVSVVGLRGGVSSANSDPADASAPVVVVTPPQARKIVEQFWPKRERARAHNDLRETRELETGAALELDNAVGADNQLLGGANLRWERPLHGFDVIVTRQTTYPAWFFASGLTNRNIDEAHPDAKPPADYLEMMVFTKQAAEAPWKLAFTTGATRASKDDILQPVTDGSPESFSPEPTTTHDPATVHAQLAAYWQYWTDHKTAPPDREFGAGYWTTDLGRSLAKDTRLDSTCHCYRKVTYYTDPNDGRWVFHATAVGELPTNYVCSTVRMRTEYDALPGRALVQDASRRNWLAELKPGVYDHIESTSLRQTCIDDRPSGGPMYVLGGNEAFLTAVGTHRSER